MKNTIYLLAMLLITLLLIYLSVTIFLKLLPLIIIVIFVVWIVKKINGYRFLKSSNTKDQYSYDKASVEQKDFIRENQKGHVIDVDYEEISNK